MVKSSNSSVVNLLRRVIGVPYLEESLRSHMDATTANVANSNAVAARSGELQTAISSTTAELRAAIGDTKGELQAAMRTMQGELDAARGELRKYADSVEAYMSSMHERNRVLAALSLPMLTSSAVSQKDIRDFCGLLTPFDVEKFKKNSPG